MTEGAVGYLEPATDGLLCCPFVLEPVLGDAMAEVVGRRWIRNRLKLGEMVS
jgi:hypothetical protein